MNDDNREVRITLRLPAKLRDRLEYSAGMNSRSMNGEIVERLDWSFDRVTQEMTDLLEKAGEADERAKLAERDRADLSHRLRTEQSEKIALTEQISDLHKERRELTDRLIEAVTGSPGMKMAVIFDKMIMDAAHGDDRQLKETLEAYRNPPSREELEERWQLAKAQKPDKPDE